MTRTRRPRHPGRRRLWPALAVLVLSLTASGVPAQAPPAARLSFSEGGPEPAAGPPAALPSPAPPPAAPTPTVALSLPAPVFPLSSPAPREEFPKPPGLFTPPSLARPDAGASGDGDDSVHEDPDVTQVGCATCGDGGGLLGLHSGAIFPRCDCGGQQCIPGREKCCSPCTHDGVFGRFLCGLYDCICCPDPCYEGRWMPLADSAFFCDAVRPITQTRLRWDAGFNVVVPDRAEYFWARADGMGRGPKPVAPNLAETRLKYNDISMYTEVATGRFSFFFEMPYRSLDPSTDPHAAGFGDMNLGTKSLIFDCELIQVAFQFRTYMPVGNATKGLGTGHVSLEPSLIVGIRIARDTYLQSQIAEWIPLGGDPTYSGSILHYHMSLNQVLARILPDVPLLGTLEMSGYSFQDGAYTDPLLGPFQKAGDASYFYLGSGLRVFVCDRIDFGVGVNLALTQQHFAEELYRSEFRFRY